MTDQKPTDVSGAEFLQLLGLQNTELIDPKVFVGDETPSGPGLHLVYDYRGMDVRSLGSNSGGGGLLLNPEAEAVFLFETATGAIEATALANPYKHGRRVQYRIDDTNQFREEIRPPEPWAPHASINAVDYEADVDIPEGEDPHIIFFTAAHELRDKIAEDTDKLTKGLSGSAVLATTVFTPIVAIPKPDKGFFVHCSIGQMVVAKSAIADEGNPISRTGEIPIEMPNAVTMMMLVHMDKELEEMGVLDMDRNKPKVLPQGAVREAFRRGARQGYNIIRK